MSHKEEDTSMPRDTRLLYVENDAVLRSMMTVLLAGLDGIEVAASVSDSTEALASEERFDVALLDWALGPNSLNGVQLGRALRERDENVGIVILSQHYAWDFHGGSGRVSMGWSYVEKRADIDTAYLTKVLKATASGLSVVEPAMDQGQAPESAERLGRLSVRQRQIMSLAATGVDANVIAEQIGLASVTVRKELSECYRILVPDPAPGTDLRTAAVVAWIEGRRVTSMDAYDN
jgi:DNA-binding NarL/FixJ family response regulator